MFIITPSLSPSICATQDVTDSLSRGKALRGYSVRCPEACCDLCFFINEVQNSWTEKRLIHLVEHFLRIPTPYLEKLSSLKMNCCSNFPVASFHWTFAVFFFPPPQLCCTLPRQFFLKFVLLQNKMGCWGGQTERKWTPLFLLQALDNHSAPSPAVLFPTRGQTSGHIRKCICFTQQCTWSGHLVHGQCYSPPNPPTRYNIH